MDADRAVPEGGFALVEVLVALVILGITFGAVLGGMATSINTSDLHRQQAQVQAVVTSAVERVKSPELARVPCATPAAYVAAARGALPAAEPPRAAWPADRIEVLSVRYSDGAGGFGGVCHDTPAQGNLLTNQEVSIRVRHLDGRADRTVTFVKGVG